MESKKTKLLFVCTINMMRSPTAEKIYVGDERFEVRSAGTDKLAAKRLTAELLDWADTIVVMERNHRNHIQAKFPAHYQSKKILCLYIPDEYDYMDEDLVVILKNRIENASQNGLLT